MALLTELMENPLDRSYGDRARARKARGEASSVGGRSPLLLIACLILGLLLTVAAQTLRVPEEQAKGQKQSIINQIERTQRSNGTTSRQITGLRSEIAQAQARTVGSSGQGGLAEQLAQTEVAAGAVAVSGPGVVVTLDDSKGASAAGVDPRSRGDNQATLTSFDLQVIANGLWQAGAEAMSINGHRLTAQSAIRFAGSAILVDYRPLARPYAITAIGRPGLWDRFRAGPTSSFLENLKSDINLDVKVNVQDRVDVPASDTATLYQARPEPTASSSPTSPSARSSTSKESP